MSNIERKPGGAIEVIEFDGISYECYVQNTVIYTHRLQSDGDHIYIMRDDPSCEGSTLGTHCWRYGYERSGKALRYSGIIQRLVSIGCVVIEQDFVDPGDIDLFTKAYGTYPELCIPFPKLTSRQEARIEYLAHILEHGQLSPADFNQPGDLYL